MIDPHSYYLFLEQRNAVFTYVGQMHHTIITALAKTTKSYLTDWGIEYKVLRRIYSVVVEALENISRHGIPDNIPEGDDSIEGLFLLCYEHEHLFITTGNYIDNSIIPTFSEKFKNIILAKKTRLQELYTKTLRIATERMKSAKQEHSTGAGIGMIDIALKSDQNINYSIIPVNDAASFFIMEVKVKIK